MSQTNKVGRLAFRHEGSMWNAYWAKPLTMEGAHLLGSIRMSFVEENPELRASFIELMRECMSHVMVEVAGINPEWKEEQPAPEHEKSGHG